ncbi:MAG TPA: hypothetical protein DD789_00645 [Firmicutes bacterium]|nr:hypothetical protein [Bacillota bacterium]
MIQRILQGVNWLIYKGIWLICLGLSITASILHYRPISDDPYYMALVPVMIITVECLAQLILSQGKANWRDKQYWPAAIKIGLYGVYILIFGVMSSMMFFLTKATVQEITVERALESRASVQAEMALNEDLIKTLTKSLGTEAESGYGRRSEAIMAQIDRVKAENVELKAKAETQEEAITPAEVTTGFSSMAKVTGISADRLKIISFGALILFVYIGLIVLNPVAPAKNAEPNKLKPVTNGPARNVTKRPVTLRRNTPVVTSKTEGLNCPVCGKPLEPGQTYCCNACKQKAYRERKREKKQLQQVKREALRDRKEDLGGGVIGKEAR